MIRKPVNRVILCVDVSHNGYRHLIHRHADTEKVRAKARYLQGSVRFADGENVVLRPHENLLSGGRGRGDHFVIQLVRCQDLER
jgi:hypothetical protein